VSGQLHTTAALPLRKEPLLPTRQVAGVGPKAGLNTVAMRKNSCHYQNSACYIM